MIRALMALSHSKVRMPVLTRSSWSRADRASDDAAPKAPRWRWTIFARMSTAAVVLSAPLILLILAVIWNSYEAAREMQRSGLVFAARSIAGAVDAELSKYAAIAAILSRSPHLMDDGLDRFALEAAEIGKILPGAWIAVADLSGQQLFSIAARPGASLGKRQDVGLENQARAFKIGMASVSSVFKVPALNSWTVALDYPIYREGAPYRSLIVAVPASRFLPLLNAGAAPADWILGFMDREGRYIARSPESGLAGDLASAGWRSSMGQDGVVEFQSREGDPVVNANAKSTASGWTIGIAAKKDSLDSAALNAIRWSLSAGALGMLASIALMLLIARRIAAPIAELQRKAPALLSDPRVHFDTSIPELTQLWRALKIATTERFRSETALEESERRLRTASEAAGFGIHEFDPATQQSYWSAGMRRIVGGGLSGQVLLRDVIAAIHPDDRVRILDEMRAIQSRIGPYEIECRIVRPNGGVRWILDRGESVGPLDPTSRLVARIYGTVIDITDRKLMENSVRERLHEIESLYENAPIGLALLDAELRFLRVNESMADMNGTTIEAHIGKSVWDIVPAVRETMEPAFRRVVSTGEQMAVELAGETPRDPGVTRYWVEKLYPVKDRTGAIVAVGVAVDEITERKRAEETRMVLMQEVNHRAKNMLSVVQSIAFMTKAATYKEFLSRFNDRVQALSKQQDLLVKNDWQGVGLEDLVRAELSHFDDLFGSRIAIAGPRVTIGPAASQGIGMALHELATNAVKYGSLSNDTGSVDISWSIDRDGFEMSWTEAGGPAVKEPARKGFGSRIISSAAEQCVSGLVQLDYAPDGVQWRLRCAVRDLWPR